jgi:hypothetical protein
VKEASSPAVVLRLVKSWLLSNETEKTQRECAAHPLSPPLQAGDSLWGHIRTCQPWDGRLGSI